MTLCHGEVVGQAGAVKGIKYGHAWIEFSWNDVDMVVDLANGKNVCLPRVIYYKMGEIETNVHRYTKQEARNCMEEFSTYGCWHLETETGL